VISSKDIKKFDSNKRRSLDHAKKSPKNLANTLFKAQAILNSFFWRLTLSNFFRSCQVPLAVTSSTWQTSQLEKLTWQVDLSPCPLVPLQITWQVITCQLDKSFFLSFFHHISTSVGPWFNLFTCRTSGNINDWLKKNGHPIWLRILYRNRMTVKFAVELHEQSWGKLRRRERNSPL